MGSFKISRYEETQIERIVQDLYKQGHPQLDDAYTAVEVKEDLLALPANSLTVRQAAQLKLVALYLIRNRLVPLPHSPPPLILRNHSEQRLAAKQQELLLANKARQKLQALKQQDAAKRRLLAESQSRTLPEKPRGPVELFRKREERITRILAKKRRDVEARETRALSEHRRLPSPAPGPMPVPAKKPRVAALDE